jgi:t-SNARE complex subunit (syntaxin)
VNSRNGELKKIEENIVELRDLYHELFTVVANQETTIPIIMIKTNNADETLWDLSIAKCF